MKRRTLLAALGSGTAASAGCLDSGRTVDADTSRDGTEDRNECKDGNGNESTNENGNENESTNENGNENESTNENGNENETCTTEDTYERCGRLIVSYDSLPDPVRCEVDAALEGDGYAASDRLLLEEAMDVDHAYVRRNETTYEPTISESDGDRTLALIERDRLTRRRVHEMRVENATDDRRTISLTVTREVDGETVVDETLALEADERESVAVSDVLGRYECAVADDRGLEETFRSRLDEYFQFDALVVDGDLSLFESTADVAPCSWER